MSSDPQSIPPFLGRDEAEPLLERAAIAILPVPYEATVCWKRGTARGPEAIEPEEPVDSQDQITRSASMQQYFSGLPGRSRQRPVRRGSTRPT